MIAKSKINSIETLISQAVIDSEMSHKEFKTFINEKEKYEKMKKNKIKWKFKKLMLKKDELNEEEGEKIKTNKNTGENNGNA